MNAEKPSWIRSESGSQEENQHEEVSEQRVASILWGRANSLLAAQQTLTQGYC